MKNQKKITLILFIFYFIFLNHIKCDYAYEYDIFDEAKVSNPLVVDYLFQEIKNGNAPLTNRDSCFPTNSPPVTYNQVIRPTGKIDCNKNIDKNGSLIINAMLSLRQIVSLDEKSQILTSSFYILLKWNDPRLMWEPSEYNNTKSITVSASHFWLPDLAILNSASQVNLIDYPKNLNVIVSYDGSSYLTISLSSQQTRCRLNMYNYPFDIQNCSIIIGSWSNNGREFYFSTPNQSFSLSNFNKNPTWNLEKIEQSSLIDSTRFEMANLEFNLLNMSQLKSEDIGFYLILKRKPLYIMINGIFPCLVLNCVILFAFGVPFVQQIQLCMTSLLTFVVTSLRISSDIPIQSEYLPLVTLYMILSIIYTLIGFLWFIIRENLTKRKSLPMILVKLASIIKRILFFNCKKQSVKNARTINQSPVGDGNNINKPESSPSCLSCSKCELCSKNEKLKLDLKSEIDSNIEALNNLAFVCLFATILACNTAIWLSIRN